MKHKPPFLPMSIPHPLQDAFTDRDGNMWGIARLIDDTADLKPFDCPIAALDLSSKSWEDYNILDIAWHCKRVSDADLSKPIILAWDGTLADGRHRVIKAIMQKKRTIKAVRMTWRPEPCRHKATD